MYIVGDAGTGKNAAILSAAKSISDALGMNLVTGYDIGTLDRPYNEIVRDLPILTEPLHKQSQYMFGGAGTQGIFMMLGNLLPRDFTSSARKQ